MTTTRSVQTFFEELGHPRHLFRYIRVQRDEEGKKNPIGEKNNMTEAEVRDKRGAQNWAGAPDHQKYLSFHVKLHPNLHVVDFDDKEDSELRTWLHDKGCAFTETRDGYHYYVLLENIGSYTQQLKVQAGGGKDGLVGSPVDLLRQTNAWEQKDRTVTGTVLKCDWSELERFFNTERMNFEGAPKPKAKPKPKKKVTIGPDSWVHGLSKEQADAKQAMDKICADDRDTWIKVGMVCKNQGEDWRELWDEWSKTSDKYDQADQDKAWDSFRTDGELGLGTLMHMAYPDRARSTEAPEELFAHLTGRLRELGVPQELAIW